MKLEFDNLELIEAKMLLDVLTAFRSGQSFSWVSPKPKVEEEEKK